MTNISQNENSPQQDRYPGIRAFEQHEQNLFYGRSQEIRDLFRLVMVERLVVLFAKSGIGKSSLLNAGLSPALEEEGFLPIHIRLQSTEIAPLDILYDALKGYGRRTAPYSSKAELWQAIKTTQFPENRTPVFILDQFEEFFSHQKSKRTEFIRQLALLLRKEAPEEVEDWLYEHKLEDRRPEVLAWYDIPDVRVVLAVRSDRLSELNEMTTEIPMILHNRFELKPLNHQQAKAAILQPAEMGDKRFATPPFDYDEATIEKIIRNLDPLQKNEIESFQLQILCGEIEKQVKAKIQIQAQTQNQNSSTQSPVHQSLITITPDYLGGKDGIAQILNNYYENRIVELGSASDQQTARKLIEEELIAEDKRVGVAAEKVNISPELLNKLLLSRLIRVSNTHLGKSYEISHDTLVEPILKSYEKRKLEEERLQRERERVEESRKRRKALFIGFLGGVLFLGAVALAGYAILQKNEADTQREEANKQRLEAIEKGKMAVIAQQKADSSTYRALEQQEIAEQNICRADSLLLTAKAAQNQANKATKQADKAQDAVAVAEKDIEAKKKEVVKLILEQVDKLFLQLDYEQALQKTREAADLKVLEKEVAKRYMEYIYWHTETHQYDKAKKILESALQLNPNAQVQSLLQKTTSMRGRKALEESLKAMDGEHYRFLEKRYYPHMIEVDGGIVELGEGDNFKVEVSDFAIAETETTVFQFALYCQATYATDSLKIESFTKASWGKEGIGLNPVIYTNWYDAVQYCNWVSEQKGRGEVYEIDKENKDPNNRNSYDEIKWTVEMDTMVKEGYRLPTEAEWEYAARGGKRKQKTIYAGGNEIEEVGWYDDNSGSRTHPVKTKNWNELGLYDMSGNVFEWCFDWYVTYPADTLITDYFANKSGSYRVLRGGGWISNSEYCRVAYRNRIFPYIRDYIYGFRCAYSL
ncbi:MAG: SUMF1/EgtB/PvdO family nonheme iron enzyme [Chitinophagales bacterium]